MKRAVFFWVILFLGFAFMISSAEDAPIIKPKIILLIAEQNIQGPQRGWWVGEIDLSTTEITLARKLIESGFEVLEPSNLTKIIKKDRAFRLVNISEVKSIKLGNLSKANYVVLGKAIASSGAKVLQSNMISCFGNITAKLIRVKDGKAMAYLDASGGSAHTDVIIGGREALNNAAEDLAAKIINALSK
jgi:hypothetical protein